jgi:RimJ/RimL family protein N-acetyltransferase
MSVEEFERTIPNRPGWKREYYDGIARVRPSWMGVRFELDLTPRPAVVIPGLRTPTPKDADALLDAFVDAFRFAPEYCGNPWPDYRRKAAEFVRGYFGEVRGRPSAASAVVADGGTILAAVLVKDRDDRPPLLDCLFTRPARFRTGLATAAATAVVNRLVTEGRRRLVSGAMLANDPSIAWHDRFGFREVPCVWVAQARALTARYEIERLDKLGLLSPVEREQRWAEAERLWAEANRLFRLPVGERSPPPEYDP